jgi:hypothetical protein
MGNANMNTTDANAGLAADGSEIISDAQIKAVHGFANFGSMSPRAVVNEGVLKYAMGYSSGHTQMTILIEHGLIKRPRPGKYSSELTVKGRKYLRAVHKYVDLLSAPAAHAADVLRLTQINADLTAANAALMVRVDEARRLMDRGLWLTDDGPAARAWLAGGAE